VGGLLIANHRDQSLWWANQKHWAAVRSYLLHSFLEVHSSVAPFTSHGKRGVKLCWAKTNYFPESNQHMLGFVHPIFTMQEDHILSTVGDALRTMYWTWWKAFFGPSIVWIWAVVINCTGIDFCEFLCDACKVVGFLQLLKVHWIPATTTALAFCEIVFGQPKMMYKEQVT